MTLEMMYYIYVRLEPRVQLPPSKSPKRLESIARFKKG